MASRSPPQSSSAPSSRRFLAAMSSPRLSPAQARPPPSPSPSWRSSIKNRECQALFLAPTRELANQIYKCITALSDFMNVKTNCCVGGTAVREDIFAPCCRTRNLYYGPVEDEPEVK